MNIDKFKLALVAACTLAAIGTAQGGPYVPVENPVYGPPTLNFPAGPAAHPGKEYTDERDVFPSSQATQSIMWDGKGGVANTFNYGVNTATGVTWEYTWPNGERGTLFGSKVDALANYGDAWFNEVVLNKTALLYSLRDNANSGSGRDVADPKAGGPAPIYVETTTGARSIWATAAQVSQHGVQNLDGLEVFGPEGQDDAFAFSVRGDWVTGCLVWDFGAKNCLITDALVASMIPGLPENTIDIDALMLNGQFIMFSLWPIAGTPIVGDGVYVMNWASGADLGFLNHGGHLWSEGWLGINVDALESAVIPEPGSLALLGVALAGLAARRRTRG